MLKTWDEEAWEDYVSYQSEDKKTLKKINALIKDIERNGASHGIGKPEPLKGNYQGWYSRRVDDKNRLVYKVQDNSILIAQCKSHYGDK